MSGHPVFVKKLEEIVEVQSTVWDLFLQDQLDFTAVDKEKNFFAEGVFEEVKTLIVYIELDHIWQDFLIEKQTGMQIQLVFQSKYHWLESSGTFFEILTQKDKSDPDSDQNLSKILSMLFFPDIP